MVFKDSAVVAGTQSNLSNYNSRHSIIEEVESIVTVAVYCTAYLPVVQPPPQVLVVLSFRGSPGGENRDKFEHIQRGIYSMYCLLCALCKESEPYRKMNDELCVTVNISP